MKILLSTLTACAAIVALCLGGVASAGTITTFDFHKLTLTDSRLTIYRQDTTDGRILNQNTYRAGSGQVTDECNKADPPRGDYVGGWLPNGWYSIWGHFDGYTGTDIRGRVWQFQDKQCFNGTLRTELFIHSEETSGQGQLCTSDPDDPFCWEGTSDYYSNGCIKISRAAPTPTDLGQLDSNWHNYSGLTGSFTLPQRLYVY